MTDSHAHIISDEISPQIQEFLDTFAQIGGTSILNVGHDPQSNFDSIKLARKYQGANSPQIKTAIGLHPELFSPVSFYNKKFTTYDGARKALHQFEELLTSELALIDAIGETGLDYYRLYDSTDLSQSQKEEVREIQIMAFRRHCELALQYKRPLTIHIREQKGSSRCIEDVLTVVTEVGKGELKGSFHSYTGETKYIEHIINLGFHIGVNGIVTYPSAKDVQEVCRQIPAERLLLETDAPFLPPQSVRQNKKLPYKLGQPADIDSIANEVAKIRGVAKDEILRVTTENYKKLFS